MAKKTENQLEINQETTDTQLEGNIETTLTQLKDRSVEKTETLEDRLQELKKAFRGKSISNYKVVIYYNDQFLETVPAVDVDFEDIESWLKNRYGGGSFAVEVRKNGAIFIHRNYMRFNILGQPKIKTEQNNASGDPVYSLLGETLSKVVNKIEQLESKVSGNNDTNYMISFMQLMMEQNKANQQMMLELLKLNQQQPHREKSFIEKLLEQLTIDKIMLLGSSVFPAVKEFFSNLSGGSLLKELAPLLEKNPNLLEKVIAKELGINEGNILDTILSDPQFLTKTLEVINGIISRPQVVVKNPALPEKSSVEPVKTEVKKDVQILTDEKENKEKNEGEADMLSKIFENQINNIFSKLLIIKQGLENGEFDNIAVAVDYVFAPAEVDMFIGYMEQFNINTTDDLLNTLNQFGINLENEINQIGKGLLNDVIQYLNGEETQEGNDE